MHTGFNAEIFRVLPSTGQAGFFLINENTPRCPARQRLKPQRPGAAEDIQHLRIDQFKINLRQKSSRHQYVEHRLARHITGRADAIPFWNNQVASTVFTRCDSHWKYPGIISRRSRIRTSCTSLTAMSPSLNGP